MSLGFEYPDCLEPLTGCYPYGLFNNYARSPFDLSKSESASNESLNPFPFLDGLFFLTA